jgi:glycerol-3-phosphate acyltransferase PlsY
MMRIVHQISVALWFGSVVFFSVAGLLLFQAFEAVALSPERPAWLPVVPLYSGTPPEGFPEPLAREQGSRAAGVAVSAIFPFYFALQSVCAVVALGTAWSLGGDWRKGLCLLGLLLALSGWGLERYVHQLRGPRNEWTDAALADPTPAKLVQARAARAAFGHWHGISLLGNFATLGVTLALVALPWTEPRTEPRPKSPE